MAQTRPLPPRTARRRAPIRVPRTWPALTDARAVAILLALTAVVSWNRLAFDQWMSRVDVLAFYLPWYDFLGERLAAFDIPGWNPHLFSGTPFAADPQSGWMYLPAMLTFPFLSGVAAFKTMVVIQLVAGILSTYALGRAIGFGSLAAMVAAVVFAFGPFLHHNTYCCTVYAQLETWLPLSLLGVELGLRGRDWRSRLAPWFLAGLGISQMMAGWLGQGAMYGLLIVGGYTAYRGLLDPPVPGRSLTARVATCVTTGIAVVALGALLGAAGLLPRLDVSPETNLAGGRYDQLGEAAGDYPPWELRYMLIRIAGDGFDHRAGSFGGVAIALSLLAPLVAGRRSAVPFFLLVTVAALTLTQDTTPLHRLFYLIPRFQVIHEHEAGRALAAATLGPAMLSGATVESLRAIAGRRRFVPALVLPLGVILAVAAWTREERFIGWLAVAGASLATAIVALVAAAPLVRTRAETVVRSAAIALLVLVFILPTGLELVESWTGSPHDDEWSDRWSPDPIYARAVEVNVARRDPDGAGEFLQRQLAERGEPFRYAGYGGITYPDAPDARVPYQTRRIDPNIQAILLNARPIRLGLYDIQGYNPVQLKRYVEFLTAVNGRAQNYHVANLHPTGVASPLLNLLNMRYVLLDRSLPPDREDVVALTAGKTKVFENDLVAVYENPAALPHAWIVHDVRPVERGEALPLLASGAVDPRRTALIEGEAPALAEPPAGAMESAEVIHYEPDAMTIAVEAAAPGMLVVSEVFASGWTAEVDGEGAPVLPANHALRGIPIPAGDSTVTLRYEPASLSAGLWITLVATLAMAGVFAWAGASWRRRRRTFGALPE